MKKKYFLTFLIFSIFLFLSGCNKSTTLPTTQTTTNMNYTLNLYLDESNLNSSHIVNSSEEFNLPMITTDELHIYVGWSNGEEILSGNIEVTDNTDLYLVQELASEVFILNEVQPEQTSVSIYGYTGQAKYLKIPEFINNLPVKSIFGEAFKDSNLIEVYIPNTVTNVYYNAFEGSSALKKVEFYGKAYGIKNTIMSKSEFEPYITENNEICTVESEIDGVVTYSESCPIKSSIKGEIIVVQGVEYYSYQVELVLSEFPEHYYQQINQDAFKDCISLETIIMPISQNTVFVHAFINTPKLKNFVFTESDERYQIVDGVIYSSDLTKLIYYPNGLDAEEFTIPDTVEEIYQNAFYNNPYLNKINIPSSVNTIGGLSFYDLPLLEEFALVSTNEDYSVENGILYGSIDGEKYLLRYPQNKLGDNFSVGTDILGIGVFAFGNNQNLLTIDLGSTIEYIGNSAFMNAKKLTILDIPNTVESLGSFMIEDSSIIKIIIRRSYVLDGSITNMYPYILRDKFGVDIYVPDDSISYYLETNSWSYYTQNIKRISEYIE